MDSWLLGKGWENVLVYQFRIFECVDFDHISFALPVCREDNNSFGLHFLCNFSANFLELGVHWMVFFIHDIWLFVLLRFDSVWKGDMIYSTMT